MVDLNSITGFATEVINIDPELLAAGGIAAMIGVFGLIFAIIFIPMYIYSALTLMYTAKRLNYPRPWMAWIPYANLWMMSELGKMPGWVGLVGILGLLSYIPVIGLIGSLAGFAVAVLTFIWMWRICEARGKPGWWPLLVLIPVAGWIWAPIMWGILAWGKD